MVTILEVLNQYVPEFHVATNEEDGTEEDQQKVVPFQVPLGGDMLTAARARTARDVRVTSSGQSALRGLFPFPSDWHAKVNFMEVCGVCVCVCVCVYVCVCMYVCMFVCTRMYACVCVCVCTCTCTYVCIYVYVCTYVRTCVCI